MKALLLAVAALAVIATSASAQRGGGGGEKGPHANAPESPKVDEKAYKAALDRIPEAKQKYDPWGGVAPASTLAPTTKKK